MGNAILNGVYYLLDSMDAKFSNKYLTSDQISGRLYADGRKLTEQDIKNIALDYEADLFKVTFKDGEPIAREQLIYLL